ncbi:MAG: U32 family peptidase C-terminal domain-containing protein [Clostridiales bacterium]|jgi:putative protease|nr:U32 family peptidase C-terminal domain-containing protein [Clostridiales bacterium]
MRKIELLAPAGNLNKLFTAFHFGADAAYIGGGNFSLRAFADNFSLDDMKIGADFAHAAGKKIFVALNAFPRSREFGAIREYLVELRGIGADAVIVSDPGVLNTVLKYTPELPVHISTQANTVNAEAVGFYAGLGVKRVVLARELSLDEIREIRDAVPGVELECFVHGAMCISYSGRCLLSNYFTGRDSNRGECVQACRWKYRVKRREIRDGEDSIDACGDAVFERRKNADSADAGAASLPAFLLNGGEYPIGEVSGDGFCGVLTEDERGTYILNGKDLRMIEHLDKLIDAGVDSFKIEGRMKSEYYVACAVNAYRRALDAYLCGGDPDLGAEARLPRDRADAKRDKIGNFVRAARLLSAELEKIGNRGYTTGFYLGENDHINTDSSRTAGGNAFIASVSGYDENRGALVVEQRNRFKRGDVLEALSCGGNFLKTLTVGDMYGENGELIEDAKIVMQKIYLKTDLRLDRFDILREFKGEQTADRGG